MTELEQMNTIESLHTKYENLKKCYTAWGKRINTQYELETLYLDNTSIQNLVSLGIIKHFELTYELGWRFLKEYLLTIYIRQEDSPKVIFRTCQELNLFPEEMTNELITLADARNETTHIYNQILVQDVCNSIEKHYEFFGKILDIIKL